MYFYIPTRPLCLGAARLHHNPRVKVTNFPANRIFDNDVFDEECGAFFGTLFAGRQHRSRQILVAQCVCAPRLKGEQPVDRFRVYTGKLEAGRGHS